MERGGGLDQPNLAVMAKQLGEHGDWLHVFPEGRISYDGKLADLRWGVGRMVCDAMKHGDGRYGSESPLAYVRTPTRQSRLVHNRSCTKLWCMCSHSYFALVLSCGCL